MKKITIVLFSVMLATQAWAYDFVYNGLYYNIIDNQAKTVEVTYQKWRSHDNYADLSTINVPYQFSYNGYDYTVIGIGEKAFYYSSTITSVVISDGVTSIGSQSFYWCSRLTSITIPKSVSKIESYAFYGCESLASLVIPELVSYIGNNAFTYCKKLSSISIPQTIKQLEDYTFDGCDALKSITLPDGLISIGRNAFRYCYHLESISIPNSVKYIGCSAFDGVGDDGVGDIYNEYNNCLYLGNNDNRYMVFIKPKNFNTTTCEIHNNCKFIYSYAFDKFSNLSSIIIPKSVIGICDFAFSGCSSLTSITIPENVTYIDDFSFSNCSSLESAFLPNTLTKIGGYAFAYCSNLKNISIPTFVESIGESAFSTCTNLKSIFIPENVNIIGGDVFEKCENVDIYCEVNDKPELWYFRWMGDVPNERIHWGYKEISTTIQNNSSLQNNITIYTTDGAIIIENAKENIEVFDIAGRQTATQKPQDQNVITVGDNGLYIVRIGAKSVKVMVK